ncbi:hypothetical protein JW905_02465 [bacterium]|nr:hypothetical protein [candidate division CSSED10-310 bacterium]
MTRYFTNPYNFAPFGEGIERRTAARMLGHDRIDGEALSGRLTADMLTLTRLVLVNRVPGEMVELHRKDEQGRNFQHRVYLTFPHNRRGDKIIPASTLKGMLRNYAEIIGDGCVSTFNGTYRYQHYDPEKKSRDKIRVDHRQALPETFRYEQCGLTDQRGRYRTNDGEGLCITCRMFGNQGTHIQGGRRSRRIGGERRAAGPGQAGMFAGKIRICDARLVTPDSLEKQPLLLRELGHPKPHHEPFYLKDGGLRGRKLYYHHQEHKNNYLDPRNLPRVQNVTVNESVSQGAQFSFTIDFDNLSREELALLCWVLDLDGRPLADDSLCHKLGLGKPIGLGSVKLRISSLTLLDPARLYVNPDQAAEEFTMEQEAFRAKLDEVKSWYGSDPLAAAPVLRDIMRLGRRFIRYPDRRRWFSAGFSKTPLPEDGNLVFPLPPRPRQEPEQREPDRRGEQRDGERHEPGERRRESRDGERREPRERAARPGTVAQDRGGRPTGEQSHRGFYQRHERPGRQGPPGDRPQSRSQSTSERPMASSLASSLAKGLQGLEKLKQARTAEPAAEQLSLKAGVAVRGIIEDIQGEKVMVKLHAGGLGTFIKPLIQLEVGDEVKVKIRRVRSEGESYEVEYGRKL